MNANRHALLLLVIIICALAAQAHSSQFSNSNLLPRAGVINGTSYSFADLGGSSISSGGGADLIVGYGLVEPNPGMTTPSGFAVINYRADGVMVSATAVPAVPAVSSGRTYAEVNGPVNTGIAFANPGTASVTVSFYFTNSATGTDFGQGSFTLGRGAQLAAFFSEAPFNASTAFAGSFTFSASSPVGVTALRGFTNERSEFLITTQIVASISQAASGPIVMAQFADGGGWKTSVELLNTSDAAMSGSVQFYNEGSGPLFPAGPITLSINGQTGSSFRYAIPAHASVHLDTAGVAATVQVGSIVVTPDGGSNSPSAQALFSFVNNGVTVTQAAVTAQPASTAFRMYVQTGYGSANGSSLTQPNSFESGIAIANTSATTTLANLELFDLKGVSTGLTASVSLPPRGHVAKMLPELFPSLTSLIATSGFRGVVRITSASGPVAVTGLLTYYNERADFLITALPPSDETAVPSTAETIFPQVAVGGGAPVPLGSPNNGYFMQFVVFSGLLGESSKGGMSFFTQTGQPMNLFSSGLP